MLWSFTVLTVLVLASAFRLTYFGAPILPVEAWIPAFELDLPRGCMGQPIGTPGENAYTLVYAVGETVMGHLVLTVVALVCMLILAIGHGRRACGGAAYRVALMAVLLGTGSSAALAVFMTRGISFGL